MMDTGALVGKISTAMRLSVGIRSATRFTVNLKDILVLLNTPTTKDTFTTEDDMRVLNNNKGHINGLVKLTYLDCKQLESALFYLMREEKSAEMLENANAMRTKLKAMIAYFDEDYDYGDYQGSFD